MLLDDIYTLVIILVNYLKKSKFTIIIMYRKQLQINFKKIGNVM